MPRKKKENVWRNFIAYANSKAVKCKFCEKLYAVANVNKMEKHLKTCLECPKAVKRQIMNNPGEAPTVPNQVDDVEVLEIETDSNCASSHSNPEVVYKMTEEKRKNLDLLISKAIFVTGAPINMVEHPLWVKVFEELQPLYKLPSKDQISTKFLDTIYDLTEKEISNELESAKNLHLQCDGWSNQRADGTFNFIISKPESFFIKNLPMSKQNTSDYLGQEILNVINIYGAEKFCTLIGDNADNIQKAFEMVRNTHSHIIPLKCIAHTLTLLCEDVTNAIPLNNFNKEIMKSIKFLKKFKRSDEYSAQTVKGKKSGDILKIPDKRWSSYVNALTSYIDAKDAFQTLAGPEYVKFCLEDKTHSYNVNFWVMLEVCIKLLVPITDKLSKLETNGISIHEVYLIFKDIQSSLNGNLTYLQQILKADFNPIILDPIHKRIKDCVEPIHLAAYMLDPRSQGEQLTEEEEIESMELISEIGKSINIDVIPDLANYRAREGFWKKKIVWYGVSNVDPIVWWKGICKSRPLSTVAIRILTTPCTATSTDRSLNVLGNVHNAKRHQLTTDKADKISYISCYWNHLKNHEIVADKEFQTNSSPEGAVDESYALQELEFIDVRNLLACFNDSDSESD